MSVDVISRSWLGSSYLGADGRSILLSCMSRDARSSSRTVATPCPIIDRRRPQCKQRSVATPSPAFTVPKYSNCFIFAARMWLARGGYLVVRKSRAGWFPHFLWCADLANAVILHFSPRKIAPWWYRPIHLLCFRGVVKRDDR